MEPPLTAATQSADNERGVQGCEQGQDAASTPTRTRRAWSDSGNGWCWKYCAGGGGNLIPQDQDLGQKAKTGQHAESLA